MRDVNIGCCVTGSFCTFDRAFDAYREFAAAGARLLPVMSDHAYKTDTRFHAASDARRIFESVAGREIIHTIRDAEPIGPKKLVDLMVVMPCTGNTISKIANAIVDTPVTMAVKSTLRVGRPVLIAVSTNDGLGNCAKNIGQLLATKNVFFVPFAQDDPENKPQSVVARFDLAREAAQAALEGRQLQPILTTNVKSKKT